MRFSLLPLSVLPLALQAQQWTQLPDFPGTARDDAAAFAINGRLYVGTGMEVGFALTNDWYAFETQTGTWSPIAPMPATPRQYCTAFTVNDTGYVFGGLDANGPLNELWAYYPATDSWQQKASLPAAGRFACAATEGLLFGVVATGMMANNQPTSEAWKYEPTVDQWQPLNPVPGPARHRAAFFLGEIGLIIAGGADSSYNALSDAWMYPVWFETGLWYPEPDLPMPRYGADGGGGLAPIVCGGASAGPDFHEDAWMLSGAVWQSLPPFPGGGRRGAAACGSDDGPSWELNFFYGLGLDEASQRHNDWWLLRQQVGMDEPDDLVTLLSPNPGTHNFNVQGLGTSPVRVTVTDHTGRSLLTSNGTDIDASHFPSGVFLVRVETSEGHIYQARWVKL